MPRAKAAATSAPAVAKKRVSGPVTERKRTPRAAKSAPMMTFDATAHYDEIAHAAYLNYVQRAGGPGSPEDDWFAAESSVRAKYAV